MPLSLQSETGARPTAPYLSYPRSVEQPTPEEQSTFVELSRTMQHITPTMASRYRLKLTGRFTPNRTGFPQGACRFFRTFLPILRKASSLRMRRIR